MNKRYLMILYLVGKTMKSFETLLLRFRHGMHLEEQFGLNPWLCLSCLNDPTQSTIEMALVRVK